MQTQPTVSFDGVPIDEAARDAAMAHIHELDHLCRDITGCHVVLSQPHRHPEHGRLWSVRVDLVVPGLDIIVNRTHQRDHAHEDPLRALRDAFAAARRRLEEHLQERRGDVKAHRPHEVGKVLRVMPAAGYGFIATPDGREVFFHSHAIPDVRLGDLLPGTPVRFVLEDGDEGPQATWVHVTGKAHLSPPNVTRGEVAP